MKIIGSAGIVQIQYKDHSIRYLYIFLITNLFYSNCSISSIALKISRITCGTMAFSYPLIDSCLHFVKEMVRLSTLKGTPSFPRQTGD